MKPMIRKKLLIPFAATAILAIPAIAENDAAADPGAAGPPSADASDSPAWLGVWAEPLPAIIADHLGLAKGSGLAINRIAPGSPADQAGIQPNDVVTKVGDQILWNQDQFTALIRSRKPGERVDLHVLRAEEPMVLTPTLAEVPDHMIARGGAPRDPLDPPPWGRRPVPQWDMDADAKIDPLLRGFLENPDVPDDIAAMMERQLLDMRGRMEGLQNQLGEIIPEAGGIRMNIIQGENTNLEIKDNNGSIRISAKDGKTTLRATDPDGKIIYEGPYDTEEEKAMAPADIRDRAARLNIRTRIFGLDEGIVPEVPADDNP